MEKTKPIFHSIALITLIATFLLFWHFSTKEADIAKQPSEIMPTLFRHLSVMLFVSLLAIPLGFGSAFYIEEWLAETNWIRRFIESKIAILESDTLASVWTFGSSTVHLSKWEHVAAFRNVNVCSNSFTGCDADNTTRTPFNSYTDARSGVRPGSKPRTSPSRTGHPACPPRNSCRGMPGTL